MGRKSEVLDIRPTEPADLPSLGALFADRFGHGLSAEEWHWKYRQVPGEGRSLVAVESGSVVAHAGALALPGRWPGGEGPVWQLADFAGITRRRGLRAPLVDLGKALLADLPRPGEAPWIFGFPSERHFRLGERVFGYRPLASLEPLTGELPKGGSEARLETGDRSFAGAEDVWERCGGFGGIGGIGVRRSAAFLDWRYWARPQRYYRFFRMLSGREEGFAVFAFAGREAHAAELWLPAGAEWYPALLAVAADLRAAGLETWRFWPRGWPSAGIDSGLATALGLRPVGERPERRERLFIGCRGRAGGPDPAVAAAGFPYSMGDYDLV